MLFARIGIRTTALHPLVRQYQLTLDTILSDRPDLQDCAVACCHCGIRFLTHPRNARRRNLRCPFGCRTHHRRHRVNERSRKHYGTPKGRRNKKLLNGKRSKAGNDSASLRDVDAAASSVDQATSEESADTPSVNRSGEEAVGEPATPHATGKALGKSTALPQATALRLEDLVLDDSTLANSLVMPYVLMVASVIERRTISRDELIAALRKRVRQRSFDRWPRREYVLRYLHEHPP